MPSVSSSVELIGVRSRKVITPGRPAAVSAAVGAARVIRSAGIRDSFARRVVVDKLTMRSCFLMR